MFGRRASQHSVWLFPLNSGSCNGCEQEIGALHAARYTLAGSGIAIASSPRHADILLLTGVMTPRSQAAARRVWEQLAEPRAIVAVGDCPINGSVFRGADGLTPAGEVLPIDVELPGCPPSPTLILEAIEAAVKLLDQEEESGEEVDEEEEARDEQEEKSGSQGEAAGGDDAKESNHAGDGEEEP